MDINNGYDRWLTTPPDETEQEYCESCGQPMELCTKGYTHFTCENQFCPEKFEKYKGGTISVVLDMSERLAEVEQELADTQSSLKYARARLSNVQLIRERREKTIEELEQKITELTQSQSNVVVRDTEYAIKRLTEAFDYHEDDCDPYAMSVFRKEWAEIKKILESYG